MWPGCILTEGTTTYRYRTGSYSKDYNILYNILDNTDNMPQMCLYLDEDVQEMVKMRAKERGSSVSSYVNEVLKKNNENRPPEKLLKLLGSWKDDPMEEPEELPWSMDIKRKTL